LTVQGDFDKIIDVGRTEIRFLTVLMGNPSISTDEFRERADLYEKR
jgi:hypothetical protein